MPVAQPPLEIILIICDEAFVEVDVRVVVACVGYLRLGNLLFGRIEPVKDTHPVGSDLCLCLRHNLKDMLRTDRDTKESIPKNGVRGRYRCELGGMGLEPADHPKSSPYPV